MKRADAFRAIDLILEKSKKAIRQRLSTNAKLGAPASSAERATYAHALDSYEGQLRSLGRAASSKSKANTKKARSRIAGSFASRLIATVRATSSVSVSLPYAEIEKRAKELSLGKSYKEVVKISSERKPGKPGQWRPIAKSGLYRKAQQILLCDMLAVAFGDSECDSTVMGAGGEARLFENVKQAIAEGYVDWVSIDIRDFFPSLKPGHLKGFPLSEWLVRNLVFLSLVSVRALSESAESVSGFGLAGSESVVIPCLAPIRGGRCRCGLSRTAPVTTGTNCAIRAI